jgi:cell division protein FtsW (lipid II flippase)
MQELLVLIVIALAIYFLPRMMDRRPTPEPARRSSPLTGRMRLAILLTAFCIAGSAAVLKPWQGDPLPFLSLGLGPAAAAWGAVWVWFGYKKYRR